MTIKSDADGTLYLFQGDTGFVRINGLNPDLNYFVYFAIRNANRELMGEEIKVTSNNSDSVRVFLDDGLTDKLTVPTGQDSEVYYYGVKITEIGTDNEDTVIPAMGERKMIIVYPKVAEGGV